MHFIAAVFGVSCAHHDGTMMTKIPLAKLTNFIGLFKDSPTSSSPLHNAPNRPSKRDDTSTRRHVAPFVLPPVSLLTTPKEFSQNNIPQRSVLSAWRFFHPLSLFLFSPPYGTISPRTRKHLAHPAPPFNIFIYSERQCWCTVPPSPCRLCTAPSPGA